MATQGDFYHLLLAVTDAANIDVVQAIDSALLKTAAGQELYSLHRQYADGLITFGEYITATQQTLRNALGY